MNVATSNPHPLGDLNVCLQSPVLKHCNFLLGENWVGTWDVCVMSVVFKV